MTKYRPADLPAILHIPLREHARRGRQMTDAAADELVCTALHEAAHLTAAAYAEAHIYRVEIRPTGRADRYGALGRVHASERLPEDGAFISLVGYAWEELHGDIAQAAGDLEDGHRLADEAGESREELLDEAREFVVKGDELIRIAAAGILATMPITGVIQGRRLEALVDWFRPARPANRRGPRNAARLPIDFP